MLKQPEADTILICSPVYHYLPQTPIKNPVTSVGGNLIFTVIFLIIFAIIRLRGKDVLLNMMSILVKRKKTEIILNEGFSANLVCYLLSLFLSFSTLATIVTYFISQEFFTLLSLYIFAGLWIYHFFMLGLVHILGWTFNARNAAVEAAVNLWTYHIMAGLLISPLVIAIFYVKAFAITLLIKIIIGCLILVPIVKIIRWIEILFVHRVSISYMILYLCALEVMPILIIYKIAA